MCFRKKKKVVIEEKKEVKVETKVEATKTPRKKEVKAAPKKEETKVSNEVTYRNYHVVKREDGKWEVKFAGGKKAIKLFATQAEAVEYSKKMAENQDGTVLVHNSKGKNKGRIKSK